MPRLYCWSCGQPVSGETRGLAPLCASCAAAGPQIAEARLRWMVRTADGRSRGPLSRETVEDQLVRRALQADDRISREGGPWARVADHKDFRRFFLPGTAEHDRLHADQREEQRARTSEKLRRNGRLLAAGGFMVASVALAAAASQLGLFVVPEATVKALDARWTALKQTIGAQVATATDEGAARRAVVEGRDLPGQGLVDDLSARYPGLDGNAALELALGHIALWDGTAGSAEVARTHFERALVLSPDDIEAASGLAQTYALLHVDDLDLGNPMSTAANRAGAGATRDESVAGRLARTAVARSSGSDARAADISEKCGAPPSLAGMAGEAVDLRCALHYAQLSENMGALDALERRFPEVYPIRRARLETALATGDLSLSLALAARLAADHPKEHLPHAVIAQASASIGDWPRALEAATTAARLDPRRLENRRLRADLLLKTTDRAREALAEYEGITSHPGFDRMPDRAQILADAAAAALAAGAPDKAVDLGKRSLATANQNAAGAVQLGRAQIALGDKEGAEATLREVDINGLDSHQSARYHVAAARIYLALGRERLAVDELENAREADPFWPVAALETARARLRVDNLEGAMELVECVAYMDPSLSTARSPMHRIWYPPPDWARLKRDLERGLVGDVRFAARGAGVLGIVSWLGDLPDARRQLDKAVKGSVDVPAANAALAQLLVAQGDFDAAHGYARTVLAASQDKAVIRALLGRILMKQGRGPGGETEFNKALQDAPNDPGVRRYHALALQERGDVSGATRAWRDLLRLVPDDVSAKAAVLALEKTER